MLRIQQNEDRISGYDKDINTEENVDIYFLI